MNSEYHVAIVPLPNFTMLALSCIVDTLRLANRALGRQAYRWTVYGLQEQVVSSCGIGVVADAPLADAHGKNADIAIICGGIGGHLHNERNLRAWLRDLDSHGAIIGAISTGIWQIARAGLLDSYRCAVHWDDVPSFSATFPLVEVRSEIFVHDRRRLTCAGGVSVIDMILYLIALQFGVAMADSVADLLIHARIRSSDEKQRESGTGPAGMSRTVKRAVTLMERNIGTTLPIEVIADSVGRSTRQLERLFIEALGVSPKRHYDDIRLRHARKLLVETDIPLSDVALQCGYASQAQLSTRFRTVFAKPPLRYRQQARG
ncbi:GlxA family transcriptional regulator [Bosea sp. (in: a-proteobacteria)]|uniref:GlxA family transcriptional regulator n=1 Tax=Bosea sp. (in: a-proteobacteria) TaxID=1871050 RepID=UPI002FC866E0